MNDGDKASIRIVGPNSKFFPSPGRSPEPVAATHGLKLQPMLEEAIKTKSFPEGETKLLYAYRKQRLKERGLIVATRTVRLTSNCPRDNCTLWFCSLLWACVSPARYASKATVP